MEKENSSRQKLIETGYTHFAVEGPKLLSINKVCKESKLARASFYHYFGDIDAFIDELLEMHWSIVEQFNSMGKSECKKMIPDLYQLLSKYTLPLQFNLQIFKNRAIPKFNYLLVKGYRSSADSFALKLFKEHIQLELSDEEAYDLWLTMGESWYSRLDPNDLTEETMIKHSEEVMASVIKIVESKVR